METLDLRGLSCPLPLMRSKKYIEEMPEGQSVMIKSTEDKLGHDIRQLCEHIGASVISVHWRAGIITAIVSK